MLNFDLTVTTNAGSSASFLFDTGRDAIAWLAGVDDECEQAEYIAIEALADDGRKVSIIIPNDGSRTASVVIGERSEASTASTVH